MKEITICLDSHIIHFDYDNVFYIISLSTYYNVSCERSYETGFYIVRTK